MRLAVGIDRHVTEHERVVAYSERFSARGCDVSEHDFLGLHVWVLFGVSLIRHFRIEIREDCGTCVSAWLV